MSESARHIELVTSLVDWITRTYFHCDRGCLLVDSSFSALQKKPPMIGEYVPDVFGEVHAPKRIILGEAKIAADVENRHTCAQLGAFLRFCSLSDRSVLVMAVPWHMTRFVSQMLKRLAIQNNALHVRCVVLDGLEG